MQTDASMSEAVKSWRIFTGNGSPTEIHPRLTLKLNDDKSDLNTRNSVKGDDFHEISRQLTSSTALSAPATFPRAGGSNSPCLAAKTSTAAPGM